MIDWSKATLDELIVLLVALEDTTVGHNDLDIKLFEELRDQVNMELSKR